MNIQENFDNDSISLSFTGDWEKSTVSPHSEEYCYKSKKINDSQTSQTETSINIGSSGGTLSFWYRVNSESGYDKFYFILDGQNKIDGVSGSIGWTQVTYSLSAGTHSLVFRYTKDRSSSTGEDAAYIDDIVITNVPISKNINIDTSRKIAGTINKNVNIDTDRIINIKKNINIDSYRDIDKAVVISFNTYRDIDKKVIISEDSYRKVNKIISYNNDTRIIIAKYFSDVDINRLSLNLSTGTFSQRPSIETHNPEYLNCQNIIGDINGYKYQIVNPEKQTVINKNSITYTITGREDITDVLYRKVNIRVPDLKVSTILNALKINYNVSEFTFVAGAIVAVKEDSGTYLIMANSLKQLLDKMFSWSAGYYLKEIYCVFRNGQVYVTEKEKYKKVYDIDNFVSQKQTDQITISEKLIRNYMEDEDINGITIGGTIVSSSKITREDIYNDSPYSGSIDFGESHIEYSRGLVMSEENGNTRTEYNYMSKVEAVGMGSFQDTISKVLSWKSVVSGDSEVITDYYYDKYHKEICLTKEVIDEYKDGVLEKRRITRYTPIGNGFWGQTVSVAEKKEEKLDNGQIKISYPEHIESTSISNGAPSGQASLFTVKRLAGFRVTTEGGNEGGNEDEDDDVTSRTPAGSQSPIPIYENDIVKSLVAYKESFEGKTEKTISVAIIEGDVIDPVDGAIKYNNEIYYLTSNSITKTSKGVRQNISAVRWY